MEVQDDKNTTTVVKGAETNHPILMLYGNGNSSRFCNDNSGENVDGNEDQHTQKDGPFEEKKRSTQSESYSIIDQESSAFCVSSQCTTSIKDLKEMLYYYGSVSGKQNNLGRARFTENEAERNEKLKSFEHLSEENTDNDAINEVHGEGISDAKNVCCFDVPTNIAADLKVTNPILQINHAGTLNELTDILSKQKEKKRYHELVVEENKFLKRQVETLMQYIDLREKNIQSAMVQVENEISRSTENEISRSNDESWEYARKHVKSQLSRSRLLSSELCKARNQNQC